MPAPNYQRPAGLRLRRLNVVCQRRTFVCTGAHYSITFSGVRARRIAEPMAEFSREMCIVAKAAGIGDLAERLARPKQRAAVQKVRGAIQAKRIDELAAGRAALCKELLNIAQRDSHFGSRLDRPEIRIGEVVLDHAADARKQLVRGAREGWGIGRGKKIADQVKDGQLAV